MTKTLSVNPEDHQERVLALQKTARAAAKGMQQLLAEVAKEP